MLSLKIVYCAAIYLFAAFVVLPSFLTALVLGLTFVATGTRDVNTILSSMFLHGFDMMIFALAVWINAITFARLWRQVFSILEKHVILNVSTVLLTIYLTLSIILAVAKGLETKTMMLNLSIAALRISLFYVLGSRYFVEEQIIV